MSNFNRPWSPWSPWLKAPQTGAKRTLKWIARIHSCTYIINVVTTTLCGSASSAITEFGIQYFLGTYPTEGERTGEKKWQPAEKWPSNTTFSFNCFTTLWPCHWKWYELVKLSKNYHDVKFDIDDIYTGLLIFHDPRGWIHPWLAILKGIFTLFKNSNGYLFLTSFFLQTHAHTHTHTCKFG